MFGPRIYRNTPFTDQRGFSFVIAGPMGSGKTTELFRQLERVEIAGGKTMLFKPLRDDRNDGVKTHSGHERKALIIKEPKEVLDFLERDVDAVGIEEAQFFDDSICAVSRALIARGLRVIITGLELDSMARPFGPMPLLLAQSEYVVKLHAVCMRCGADATRTRRKIKNEEQVVVGGMDIYEPVCSFCHEKWLRGEDDVEL